MAEHANPPLLSWYPLLHLHVLVAGPVYWHTWSHPPLLVAQLLMGLQLLVLSPVNVHVYSVEAPHPPLLVAHEFTTETIVNKKTVT